MYYQRTDSIVYLVLQAAFGGVLGLVLVFRLQTHIGSGSKVKRTLRLVCTADRVVLVQIKWDKIQITETAKPVAKAASYLVVICSKVYILRYSLRGSRGPSTVILMDRW